MENNVLQTVRANMDGFSKGQKRIAQYILDNYDKAAFMTAARLGSISQVSESTVVRFAAALGYEGYPQLQKALQELIRHRLTASQRLEMTGEMGSSQVLSKVLKTDIQNIRSTLDEKYLEASLEKPESLKVVMS